MVQTFNYIRLIISGYLMYNMVTILNTYLKFPKRVDLKCSNHIQKNVNLIVIILYVYQNMLYVLNICNFYLSIIYLKNLEKRGVTWYFLTTTFESISSLKVHSTDNIVNMPSTKIFMVFLATPAACGSSWGQGLNLCHSSDPSHSSDKARSLNHWATRELLKFTDFKNMCHVVGNKTQIQSLEEEGVRVRIYNL